MKKNNKGFMLAETLIVTVFVAGVLIFLYIQFSNLSKSYEESYIYNSVDNLYALEDVKKFIENDSEFMNYLLENIEEQKYIDITDCSLFTELNYCLKLLEVENIDRIFVTTNDFQKDDVTRYSESFTNFINKINKKGKQSYRIVASFNNSTFATLRFGD